MTERIIRAFWHRGRLICTPWTTEELARRTGMTQDEIMPELVTLARRKIARGSKPNGPNNQTAWELTEAGKVQCRAMIAAETLARSM